MHSPGFFFFSRQKAPLLDLAFLGGCFFPPATEHEIEKKNILASLKIVEPGVLTAFKSN